MAKMKIAPGDRPKVKAECLRLLVTLRLDPARVQLISQFVDIYLRLNAQEEREFQAEIDTMELTSQEEIMQITTSWMERGIEQGLEQGRREEARSLVLRQLARRLGELPEDLRSRLIRLNLPQLEILAEDLLDFAAIADLSHWLQAHHD